MAALDEGGTIANYSNWGSTVDIAAPGSGILSTVPSGYEEMSGTSMAAPQVAGVAALIRSRAPAADVAATLAASATDAGAPGRDTHYGAGIVDAAAAVQAACVSCRAAQPASAVTRQAQTVRPPARLRVGGVRRLPASSRQSVSVRSWKSLSPRSCGVRKLSGLYFAVGKAPGTCRLHVAVPGTDKFNAPPRLADCAGHEALTAVRSYSLPGRTRGVRMLLSDRDIRAEIAAGRVAVEPFAEAMVQPSSLDVRLDKYFRVFENHRYPHIDPAEEQPDLTRMVEAATDEPFILHPGEFVLASTYEVVTLPDDVAGRLEGKSSLGRLGLLDPLHGRIHRPGFQRSRHPRAFQRGDTPHQTVAGHEDRSAVPVPVVLARRAPVRFREVRVPVPGATRSHPEPFAPEFPSNGRVTRITTLGRGRGLRGDGLLRSRN